MMETMVEQLEAEESTFVQTAQDLGKSKSFDHAIGDFAEAYADQSERDHGALADPVVSGRVQASGAVR